MVENRELLSEKSLEMLDYFVAKDETSDFHFKTGVKPVFREKGELYEKEFNDIHVITRNDAKEFVFDLFKLRYGADKGSKLFVDFYQKGFQFDMAITINETKRARVNIYKSLGELCVALRQIPSKMPDIEKIGIQNIHLNTMKEMIEGTQGLILVTGQTGSGKSTTLASFVNYINLHFKRHIITIEDPVEFQHTSKVSYVSHREVGENGDVLSFHDGLKASLREDPDIILVGEIRDAETALAAMQAAQTGHIVFATLHTNSVSETLTRIIDLFPPEKASSIRTSLAQSFRMIISQMLIRGVDGNRFLCYEFVCNDNKVASTIISEEHTYAQSIEDIMNSGRKEGKSETLVCNIGKRVAQGNIEYDVGKRYINVKNYEIFDMHSGKNDSSSAFSNKNY